MMNKQAEIEEKVRDLLVKLLPGDDRITTFDRYDELVDYGMLSTNILELIMRLEKQFDFPVSDDDFDERNFRTMDAIVAFVGAKVGGEE